MIFFPSFHTFDVALDICCSPIQNEEEIKQLSIPSSEEKEEKEIWSPKEPVSGNSFEQERFISPFHVDR